MPASSRHWRMRRTVSLCWAWTLESWAVEQPEVGFWRVLRLWVKSWRKLSAQIGKPQVWSRLMDGDTEYCRTAMSEERALQHWMASPATLHHGSRSKQTGST